MSESALALKPLARHRVAFTGRLASLTRSEAATLVRDAGGQWAASVNRKTTMLVIGQEGWPLRKDGRLSKKLLVARRLGRLLRPIKVISEADFLTRLGLESTGQLSTAQLGQALGVSGERIRAWVGHGLVRPVETVSGVHYFDFRQASWVKSLGDFARAGVTVTRLRRSLEQLRTWLPEVEESLTQLGMLERDGRLMVRLGDELIAESSGQMWFDFSEEPATRSMPMEAEAASVTDWFARGRDHEEKEEWEEAAHAYRQAQKTGGPQATTSFNLANVLRALGRLEQAVERLWQAVELEPGFVEAWNNLGVVLAELGRHEEAIDAFSEGIKLDAHYADLHYNLADALEECQRKEEALPHWEAYLRLERTGCWAVYAAKRIAQMRKA